MLNEKQTLKKLFKSGDLLIKQYNHTKDKEKKKLILAKLNLINNLVKLLLAPYKKELEKLRVKKEI